MIGIDSTTSATRPTSTGWHRAADAALVLAALAFAAATAWPWVRIDTGNGRAAIGVLAGVSSAGTAVYLLYLVVVPAVLGLAFAARRRHAGFVAATLGTAAATTVAIAFLLRSTVAIPQTNAVATGPTALRGFWLALAAPVLAGASALLRRRPGRAVRESALALAAAYAIFVVVTDTSHTRAGAGVVLAMVAGLSTIAAMAVLPSTAAARTGDPWRLAAIAALAVSAVAMFTSLFAGWAIIAHVDADDAEFPGDILVSPVGTVFVIAGAVLFAGTAASVLNTRRRDEWRAVTLTYAIGCIAVLVRARQQPSIVGYGFQSAVTAAWHAGWTSALLAALAAVVAVLIAHTADEPQVAWHQ